MLQILREFERKMERKKMLYKIKSNLERRGCVCVTHQYHNAIR